MTKPPRKLQREWTQRLRASGFVDLETDGPDGMLSDRGLIHPEFADAAGYERLDARIKSGAEYQRWAEMVLRSARMSAFERRVWRMHVDGRTLREIGETLGAGGYHRARNAIYRVQARVRQVGRDRKHALRQLRRGAKWANEAVLVATARLLLAEVAGEQAGRSRSP